MLKNKLLTYDALVNNVKYMLNFDDFVYRGPSIAFVPPETICAVDLVAVSKGPSGATRDSTGPPLTPDDSVGQMIETIKQNKKEERDIPLGDTFYILQRADGGIKVGVSINMPQRIKAYRTLNPDIRIVKLFNTPKLKLMESIVLDRFAMSRIGGAEVIMGIPAEKVVDYSQRLFNILHEYDL